MGAVGTFFYKWRATEALLVCIILSVGGILLADQPSDAGRGGAIAVALSLAILFCAESPGVRTFRLVTTASMKLENLLKELDDTPPEERKEETPEQKLEKLEANLIGVCEAFVSCQQINERALLINNAQMALGSAIGTIAWGFGDLLVRVPATV